MYCSHSITKSESIKPRKPESVRIEVRYTNHTYSVKTAVSRKIDTSVTMICLNAKGSEKYICSS